MGVDFAYLKKRIAPIMDVSPKLQAIRPGVFYSPGPWCVTKLISLAYFNDIYTKIIPRVPHFKKMRYIELFSGSGLCKIEGTGDIIIGSPVIAAKTCNKEYDAYILVEENPDMADALNERMKTLTNNCKVINQDCNEVVGDIVAGLDKNDHYLAFVDPEGLEVRWSTMATLLSRQGDLLFNFQTSSVARVLGAAKAGIPGDIALMNSFFGDSRWKDIEDRYGCLDTYVEKIKEDTDRTEIVTLPVRGERGFRYDMILATKTTRGGNPWLRPMTDLAESFSTYNPAIIKQALNILSGRIRPLDSFR